MSWGDKGGSVFGAATMRFQPWSAFDFSCRMALGRRCLPFSHRERVTGTREELAPAHGTGRQPKPYHISATFHDSLIKRSCCLQVSCALTLFLFVSIGMTPLLTAGGPQQITPINVVGTITDVRPSSLTVRAMNGDKINLYSHENYTGKVEVGSIVEALYYVYNTGNALGSLEHPPPTGIDGVVTAVDPSAVIIRGKTGQTVKIQTEENLTAKLQQGSVVTAWYYPLTAGNFLYQLKQSPSPPPPQAAKVTGQPTTTPMKAAGQAQKESAPPAEAADDYIIGASDVLNISVWGEPQLSGVVTVRPDGKISTPLAGEVQASGQTPLQLQAQITEKLRGFVENPVVTVIVQEVRSLQINVVGQVQRPGAFPLTKSMRVLDAIALAGGFREFAKVRNIYVLRTDDRGAQQMFPFDYKQVVKGRRPDQNIELMNGDTVVVP
jgi:polysaccharide export outer membrane protein